MAEKDIEAAFDKRAKEAKLPTFYPFENAGDKIIGKIIGSHTSKQWGEPENILHVEELGTGEIYCIPGNVVVKTLIESQEVVEGDYIMLKFLGWGKSKAGRGVKDFTLGKMTEEEFAQLKGGKPIAAKKERKTTPKPEPEPAAEHDEKATEKLEDKYEKDHVEELQTSVNDIMQIYDAIEIDKFESMLKKVGVKESALQVVTLVDGIEIREGKVHRA